MKKKILLPLISLVCLVSCNQNTSSSIDSNATKPTPVGELQTVFSKLVENNNFTLAFRQIGYEGEITDMNFYFTNYSFQQGDSTSAKGIAQGDGLIYRYTINDDDSITSSTPIVNTYTGVRYESVYSYINSVKDLDISKLPTEVDSSGYYNYDFSTQDKATNDIIESVFLRLSTGGEHPESLKIKVIGDSLVFESVLLTYNASGENPLQLKVESRVFDIDQTENSQIKSYIDSGKTAKNPIDLKFFSVFNKYLGGDDNYTIDVDSTSLNVASYRTKFSEYRTSEAILDTTSTSNSGVLVSQGALHSYVINNGKVEIKSTPLEDENTFYTSLFGEYRMSFSSFDYSLISGYVDDNNSNTYYLTDSQFVSYFATLCQININDSFYTDSVKIEITDFEKYEFIASFDMYNKTYGNRYGSFSVKFHDVNNTKIEAVDKYLSLGDDPTTQTNQDLKTVLDEFNKDNYSIDVLIDGVGMAKAYYTSSYYFIQAYGSPTYNEGYFKSGDKIYSFTLEYDIVENSSSSSVTYNFKNFNVSTQIDYASQYKMSLPGAGSYYSDEYSMNYLSRVSDSLYDYNNYQVSKDMNLSYWKSSDAQFSIDMIKYIIPSVSSYIPVGFGLLANANKDDMKLSFIFMTMSNDGTQQGYSTLTYYDIGKTSSSLVEQEIAKFNANN